MRQSGIAPILIILLIALGIGGYFVYTNYSNQQTKREVENHPIASFPIPTSSPIAIVDENEICPTAGVFTKGEVNKLKVYRNSELGLTFSYPINYTEYEGFSEISILSPLSAGGELGRDIWEDELKILIHCELVQKEDSLQTFYNEVIADGKLVYGDNYIPPHTINTVLGGIEAKYLKSETSEEYLVINKGYKLIIVKAPSQTTRQQEADQILSTFKFTQ